MRKPILCLLLLLQLSVATAALEKKWTLLHSIGSGEFSPRASLVLAVGDEEDAAAELTITNDNSTVNEQTFAAAQAPGALYQIQLVEQGSSSSNSFLLASVPACQVLRANFREEVVVSLGPHATALSMSYMPLVSPLAPKSCDTLSWEEKKAVVSGWVTKVSWELDTPGMSLRAVMPQYKPPPGLHWLPRPNAQGKLQSGPPGSESNTGNAKQEEAPQGPFGFMKRYWYILLPLLIANFLGVDQPPQGQSPPGGEQQQGAPAVEGGAAPAAASPSAGGAPKQRRGKRG